MCGSISAWAQDSEDELVQEVTPEATAAPSVAPNTDAPAEISEDLSLESSTVPTAEATAEPSVETAVEPPAESPAAVADTPAEPATDAVAEPTSEALAVPTNEPVVENTPSSSESGEPAGLVEIQYPDEYQGPYLENRGTHGFMFDVNYQQYVPKSMLSQFEQATYKSVYENNPIALVEVQLAYKYNFALGGLTLGLGYGGGSTSSEVTGKDRSITLTKTSLAAGYIMDALFDEPYVAPYGQIQAWQMSIKEDSAGSPSLSQTTQVGFAYTVGALIQLNWLDESSAESGAHNFGLDNTYLDLFAVKYSKTQSVTDANTESDFSFGAGLRLEY
jgi:hypothetical protein